MSLNYLVIVFNSTALDFKDYTIQRQGGTLSLANHITYYIIAVSLLTSHVILNNSLIPPDSVCYLLNGGVKILRIMPRRLRNVNTGFCIACKELIMNI